ncbi:MAG TPA: hypothetical protein PLD58_05220 [Phycisphaerae bacterium]|nr:hypothetical protein [Phycisphaerae bacterium]
MTRAGTDATTSRRPVRAFSLVEAAMSVFFVGVLAVGATRLVGSFSLATTIQGEQARARNLAELFLTEVLRARYAQPDEPDHWGLEDGEVDPNDPLNRDGYNDLDDYDGLVSQPPCDRNGLPLDGYAGYGVSVEVKYVDPVNIDVASALDCKLKRIQVTVSDPKGKTTTLRALRSSASANDNIPQAATTYVTWADVRLRLGDEPQPRRRGANLFNRVVAP